MAVPLPRIIVSEPGTPAARLAEPASHQVLSPEESDLIVARSATSPSQGTTTEHCEPLNGGRFAIGREVQNGSGSLFVWRVATPEVADAIGGHPAWLWTADAWFDPSRAPHVDVPLPEAQSLRQILRLAGPALGRPNIVATIMASLVEAVRSNQPAALLVPPTALTAADRRARWVALAVLTLLPSAVANKLRLCLANAATPQSADLALLSAPVRGFQTIETSQPPDRVNDAVAYFVQDRLSAGDPEALEVATTLLPVPKRSGPTTSWH